MSGKDTSQNFHCGLCFDEDAILMNPDASEWPLSAIKSNKTMVMDVHLEYIDVRCDMFGLEVNDA